jgi:hypothetical protein
LAFSEGAGALFYTTSAPSGGGGALQAVVINNKISNVCSAGDGVMASEAVCNGVADALKLVTVEALDDHRLQLSLSRGGPFVMAAAAMLAAPVVTEIYGLAGRISAAAVAPKAAKPQAPPARP